MNVKLKHIDAKLAIGHECKTTENGDKITVHKLQDINNKLQNKNVKLIH